MSTHRDNSPPSDETLVAFADGVLSEKEAAEVARYLETDPEAKRMVELMQRSGALAREAFKSAIDRPLPAGIADMILGFAPVKADTTMIGGGAPPEDNVVTFKRPASKSLREARAFSFPMAASVVLFLGAAVMYSLTKDPSGYEIALGPIAAGSVLEDVLERKSTGDPVLDADRVVTIMATFRDKENRPCREFESHVSAAEVQDMVVGVACRTPAGQWTVEGATRVAGVTGASGSDFSPAGGNQFPEIEKLLSTLGAKSALRPDEEQALIGSSWK